MKDIILSLVSLILLFISGTLFYTAKTKRKKVKFIYNESDKTWDIFNANFWTISETYILENITNILIASLIASILIILSVYYFFGESALGMTFAIILAIWGGIGSGVFLGGGSSSVELGGAAPSNEKISLARKDIFKVIEEIVENVKGKGKSESINYSGYIDLPSKIYVDESEKITIYLDGKIKPTKLDKEGMVISQVENTKLIDVNINRTSDESEFFKVEIQAASLKIGGDFSQQVSLTNNIIKFHWSISSDKTTIHKISLLFSKISGSSVKYFQELDHTVKVVNLLGLSRRTVWLSGILLAIIAIIPTILKILEFLGYRSNL